MTTRMAMKHGPQNIRKPRPCSSPETALKALLNRACLLASRTFTLSSFPSFLFLTCLSSHFLAICSNTPILIFLHFHVLASLHLYSNSPNLFTFNPSQPSYSMHLPFVSTGIAVVTFLAGVSSVCAAPTSIASGLLVHQGFQ